MRLTAALKSWGLAKSWWAADATDDVIKQIISAKMVTGELEPAKLAELTAESGTGAKKAINDAVAEAVSPLSAQLADLAKSFEAIIKANRVEEKTSPDATKAAADKVAAEKATADAFQEGVTKTALEILEKAGFNKDRDQVTPTQLFARGAKAAWVNGREAKVEKAIDRFDKTKSAAVWGSDCKHTALRGKRLTTPSLSGPGMGRPLDIPSKADEAVSGAFFKWSLHCNSPGEYPAGLKMTDQDWDIVKDAVYDYEWTGTIGQGSEGLYSQSGGIAVDGVKLSDDQRKALLDDSTSGGITLVPQVFDDAIIMTPLLYGELFPLVTVENISQGRRIEAPTMGRPTFTSGIAESTAIPLYDTTGFIGALDTVIQNAVGAIEIGNDFQEDSSVANIGQKIIAAYGESAQQWLDMVIAVGDGTTQPRGIFNTSGVTSVTSVNGAGGPVAIGDLEGAMFGLDKAYRKSRMGRNIYLGNEVTYKRVMQIPTGTGYNTRAMGFDAYTDYMVFGVPFKISTDVPNNKLAFVNMAYYKMYRRLGAQIKTERGGKELTLRNVTLITCRMRYGGSLQLGSSAAVLTDLEA